uniref:Secreted protein n=1 Tax=Arundo donax TaxID=35708 RepID=A0A0A9DQR9_ARUDO
MITAPGFIALIVLIASSRSLSHSNFFHSSATAGSTSRGFAEGCLELTCLQSSLYEPMKEQLSCMQVLLFRLRY